MKNVENEQESKEWFRAWWNRSSISRPLMGIKVRRDKTIEHLEPEVPSNKTHYLNVEELLKRYLNYLRNHLFIAEAHSNLSIDIGSESMALYLDSEPIFDEDIVWVQDCVDDWNEWGPLRYNPSNAWWKGHVSLIC